MKWLLLFLPLFLLSPTVWAQAICTRVLIINDEVGVPGPFDDSPQPLKVKGQCNCGIYLYRGHILKVVIDKAELDQELASAQLMESLGGPKVIGYGTIDIPRNGVPTIRWYLELEQLSPAGLSFKEAPLNVFNALLAEKPAREAFATNLAQKLVEAYEKNIYPGDPDVWVESTGALRWIDAGNWRARQEGKADRADLASTVWTFISRLDRLDQVAGQKVLVPRFLQSFLESLRLAELSPKEKHDIVYALGDLPGLLRAEVVDRGWPQKLLFRYEILPEEKISTADTQDIFRNYCFGLVGLRRHSSAQRGDANFIVPAWGINVLPDSLS